MKNILVTGACGQIGTELVPALRQSFGDENVVAAGHETPIPEDMKASGPFEFVDVTDYDQIDAAMERGLSPANAKRAETARPILADAKKFAELKNFYAEKIANIERRRSSGGFVAGLLAR